MANEVLLKDCVIVDLNVTPAKKENALESIAEKLSAILKVDTKQVRDGLFAREDEGTTGFTDGIAIPHTQVPDLEDARIGVVTFGNPIEWESLDGKPIEIATVLLTPNSNGNNEHLKLLSKLSRKLISEDFVKQLHENKHNQDGLFNMIAEIVNQ